MASKLKKLPLPPGLKKAIVKDVKSTSDQGGTFSPGAWRTRDLNTVEGDDIVTVASNQFTLPGGSYMIYASLPVRSVIGNKGRLYNVTASAVEVVGTTHHSERGGYVDISAILDIGSATTFEIQHRCEVEVLNQGFGPGLLTPSTLPIFTAVIILKL